MNTPAFEKTPIEIPYKLVYHTITVPVLLGDSIQSRFILDTGIGGNLISKTLCKKVGCELTGQEFRGKRMSGQEVSAPLSIVSSISLASFKRENVSVGVFDFPLPPDFVDVEGFLSLQFFSENPFTIDYKSGNIIIEHEASMLSRLEQGSEVDIRLENVGPLVEAFFAT